MLASLLPLSPAALIAFTAGLYPTYIVLAAIFDPLRSVPGPFLARFTRLWYFYAVWRGDFELVNIELHKRYGAVVRVAPGEYSIDDVEGAKLIYGHGAGFIKAPWYWAWMPPDPEKASLFADLNPHRHGIQRRKYAAAYSMSSLVTYEPYVDNCTSLLLQRFSELASQPQSQITDMGHWLQCYAFDVIGEITFGKRFGFLGMGIDSTGVFKAIDQRGVYSTFVGIFPWLHAWIYPFLPKTGGHGYVAQYTLDRISARQSELKNPRHQSEEDHVGPPDFLSRFLMAHESDPERMTRMDLFTICQSNIGAGSDTTAITLSAILYNLISHPATLSRLRSEIDDAYSSGLLVTNEPISFKAAQELKYLQAVVKEGLRLHSATGLPMQRVVPAQGIEITGRRFPPGASVGINAWVAHRNRAVFGEDADIWRPERWLEIEEQGRGGDVEKYFFAFGQGSRTCIGKNISLLEIQKLIPTLVQKFNFELVTGKDGQPMTTKNRWFVKQVDFYTTIKERERELKRE